MTKTGYIYKIADKAAEFDEIYVGSTTRLRQRKLDHKRCCNNPNNKEHNQYKYQFIRENGGFDNFELYELEEIQYDDKKELLKKEREWIERLKPELNKAVPTRTCKEYYEDNKGAIHARHKQYREVNKDAICAQTKQYRETHKEAIREQRKQYREANKETVRAKQNERHDCPCGGKFTRANKAEHERCKKHQDYLSSQSNTPNTSNYNSDSDSD